MESEEQIHANGEAPEPPRPDEPARRELPAPTGEQRTWAMLAHLLALPGLLTLFGWLTWVGPLVVWVCRRKDSPFVAFHALQSLLFQLAWIAIFLGLQAALVVLAT